jgi:uncharacterized protein RhaS with RHS repeats
MTGYSYDAHHNLTSQTFPSGKSLVLEYDAADRLTTSTAKSSSGNEQAQSTYTYTSRGWQGRPDLVTQALVLLERDGLVLIAAGSTRAWKITAAGRLMLAPRRGPARERPVIGGGPHPR